GGGRQGPGCIDLSRLPRLAVSSLWPGLLRFARLGGLGVGLLPELLVAEPVALADLLPAPFEDLSQHLGAGHDQSPHLRIILPTEQHGDRSSVSCHDARALLALLDVSAELRLHIRDRCDLHSFSSSPPMNRRFFSFSPMAKISTCRSSGW